MNFMKITSVVIKYIIFNTGFLNNKSIYTNFFKGVKYLIQYERSYYQDKNIKKKARNLIKYYSKFNFSSNILATYYYIDNLNKINKLNKCIYYLKKNLIRYRRLIYLYNKKNINKKIKSIYYLLKSLKIDTQSDNGPYTSLNLKDHKHFILFLMK